MERGVTLEQGKQQGVTRQIVVVVSLAVKTLPTTNKRDAWRLANVLAREANQYAAEVDT